MKSTAELNKYWLIKLETSLGRQSFYFFVFFSYLPLLDTEPRTSAMLGKHLPAELYPNTERSDGTAPVTVPVEDLTACLSALHVGKGTQT